MLNSECNYVHLFILEWYILFLDWFRLMLGWWMYDMNSNWQPCDQNTYKHIKWLPLCTSLCMRVFQPLFSCFWPVFHTKNRNNNFIACECLACTQDNDIHTYFMVFLAALNKIWNETPYKSITAVTYSLNKNNFDEYFRYTQMNNNVIQKLKKSISWSW